MSRGHGSFLDFDSRMYPDHSVQGGQFSVFTCLVEHVAQSQCTISTQTCVTGIPCAFRVKAQCRLSGPDTQEGHERQSITFSIERVGIFFSTLLTMVQREDYLGLARATLCGLLCSPPVCRQRRVGRLDRLAVQQATLTATQSPQRVISQDPPPSSPTSMPAAVVPAAAGPWGGCTWRR